MSKQTINIGASPNDGTGTPLRTSFDYTNQNFTELYTALGGGVGLPGATTQVIFNDGGTNLAGDAGLVYNKTTDTLTAGNATITGAATVGTTLGVTGVSTLASVGVTGAATVGTTLGVTGVSSFAAGTALLPSITRTGDTNTGAYFPAADTFAVTTGGTEAYRADSLGNFLVGTSTSPTGTKVGAIAKLSTVSIEGTASIAVSTTAVTLSRVSGLGGLFFVQGYADGSGVQAWWLVAANNVTTAVISSGNTTGLVPTFTIVAGQLKMVLASGTFYATSFNITT